MHPEYSGVLCCVGFFHYNKNEVNDLQTKVQDYWFSFVRNIDEDIDGEAEHSKLWSFVYETVGAAAAAVVIIFILFSFCLRGVGVVGDSMIPTLHDGDWLAVTSVSSAVKPGDVVIITQPNSVDKPLVKRVIATAGQTVDINFESHVVTVDGKVLEENYIAEPTSASGDVQFPLTVGAGQVFVMGDNRNNSLDSRFSTIGCIDENYVLGVAKYRVFPFGGFKNSIIK